MKGKGGAPKGNQNARTHGFYSMALSEVEKLELEQAVGVEGIDAEIALLRVKLKRVLEKEPQNIKLIMQAMDMLAKLLKASETMTPKQKSKVEKAVNNVVRDNVHPMGFNKNTINIGINR
ncbi:MAG: hypothetical protein HYX80_04390 [Chloroflexi bacterium]|nr:hypothetical protein [Chloroflexota bacterium]